jgi:antitoxin VapB
MSCGLLRGMGYGMGYGTLSGAGAQKTARVFRNNRAQAVRLPKGFQFEGNEVFLVRSGGEVILSEKPGDWSAFLASDKVASRGFMVRGVGCGVGEL